MGLVRCSCTHEIITPTTVREWLRTLLSSKQGAGFEKVVIHAWRKRVEAGNCSDDVWNSTLTYTYEGGRDSSGDPEIEEGEIICIC